jgi:hypothetical protein
MEKLQAEIAGLRAELQSLKDIRDDLRNVASLSHSFSSMTESYDDIRFASTCICYNHPFLLQLHGPASAWTPLSRANMLMVVGKIALDTVLFMYAV